MTSITGRRARVCVIMVATRLLSVEQVEVHLPVLQDRLGGAHLAKRLVANIGKTDNGSVLRHA